MLRPSEKGAQEVPHTWAQGVKESPKKGSLGSKVTFEGKAPKRNFSSPVPLALLQTILGSGVLGAEQDCLALAPGRH